MKNDKGKSSGQFSILLVNFVNHKYKSYYSAVSKYILLVVLLLNLILFRNNQRELHYLSAVQHHIY